MGLAAGAALLVPLNLKCRREGARFPKGQAAAILLLLCYLGGLAAVTLMDRMGSGIRMRMPSCILARAIPPFAVVP